MRCGVPTARAKSVVSSCRACSPMVPCLGKSLATRSFIGARSLRTATLRRADKQQTMARGLRCCCCCCRCCCCFCFDFLFCFLLLFLSCFFDTRHIKRSMKLSLSTLLSTSYVLALLSLAMWEPQKSAPANFERISALDSVDSSRILTPKVSRGPLRFLDCFVPEAEAFVVSFETPLSSSFSLLPPLPDPRCRFLPCFCGCCCRWLSVSLSLPLMFSLSLYSTEESLP
mmetsp:Transcript_28534/g.77236  ORF Transcript_28534/g.77236 Transcript_28534/m.77236 type:complete len:228 (+) Transcript_28534:371-1054(+)